MCVCVWALTLTCVSVSALILIFVRVWALTLMCVFMCVITSLNVYVLVWSLILMYLIYNIARTATMSVFISWWNCNVRFDKYHHYKILPSIGTTLTVPQANLNVRYQYYSPKLSHMSLIHSSPFISSLQQTKRVKIPSITGDKHYITILSPRYSHKRELPRPRVPAVTKNNLFDSGDHITFSCCKLFLVSFV